MSDNTDGYALAIRLVRISADAARAGNSPYLEDGRSYVRFDETEPGGIAGASAKKGDETVFRSEEEAERAVQALLARNAAKARTERDFRPGLAAQLTPTVIGGQSVGGFEVVSRAALVAERAEEVKLAEAKVLARLQIETAKAKQQQATVDRIAAELKDAEAYSTPDGGVLRHDLPKYVQQETRADGTSRFRGRKTVNGTLEFGPWVSTIEEATSGWSRKHGRDWETTEPIAQPAEPMRASVGVIADPEAAGLT